MAVPLRGARERPRGGVGPAVAGGTAWIAAAIGVLGGLLILLGTSRRGVGLWPDSVTYVSVAESLLAGRGFVRFDGRPIIEFPPLYPVFLALGGTVGPDPVEVARYGNAALFGAIVFLAVRWLGTHLQSRAVAAAGSVAILCSAPLIEVSIYALSEPLFTLLSLLCVLQLGRFSGDGGWAPLVLAGLFAGLGWATRYFGTVLLLTGLASILVAQRGGPRQWLGQVAAFSIPAVLPFAVWGARNYALSSSLTGERNPPQETVAESLRAMGVTIVSWLVPAASPLPLKILVALLLLSAMLLLAVRVSRSVVGGAAQDSDHRPLAIFIAVYIGAFVVTSQLRSLDPVDNRYFAPIYVPTFLLLFAALGRLVSSVPNRPVATILAVALCGWTLYPIVASSSTVTRHARGDGGGFRSERWARSELAAYLRARDLELPIFTNEPYALWILAGRAAEESPAERHYRSSEASDELAELARSLEAHGPAYLAWFEGNEDEYLYNPRELAQTFDVQAAANFSDGALYVVRRGAHWQAN